MARSNNKNNPGAESKEDSSSSKPAPAAKRKRATISTPPEQQAQTAANNNENENTTQQKNDDNPLPPSEKSQKTTSPSKDPPIESSSNDAKKANGSSSSKKAPKQQKQQQPSSSSSSLPMLDRIDTIVSSSKQFDSSSASPAITVNRYQRQAQVCFKLAVFQAAPLAFKLASGVWQPLPMLDFAKERQCLHEALRDAPDNGVRIEMDFEIATATRLKKVFASDKHMIHITCHGHPEYLAIENGWGALQPLRPQDIKAFVAQSQGDLQVVFVSCSHSRPIGEAFVQAGIRHVICCHQDHSFREPVARHFSKVLYQYLSYGETLKLSFAMAQASVLDMPNASMTDMQKYLLLPEKSDADPYHDVPILMAKPSPGRTINPNKIAQRSFPKLPPYVTARRLEIFHVLKALKTSNFVKISGPAQVGKATVASALAHFIQERCNVFQFNDMIWQPSFDRYLEGDDVSNRLRDIFDVLLASWADADVCDDLSSPTNRYAQAFRRLLGLGYLDGRQMVMIINGRAFNTDILAARLGRFISDMLHLTNTKVVLANPRGVRVNVRHSGKEEHVVLGPLDFRNSALLFGQVSQHVSGRRHPDFSTPEQFADLLVRAYHANESDLEGKSKNASLYEAIGAGLPGLTIDKAKWMPAADFDNLIHSVMESAEAVQSDRSTEK